jgi:hypothetical protein
LLDIDIALQILLDLLKRLESRAASGTIPAPPLAIPVAAMGRHEFSDARIARSS